MTCSASARSEAKLSLPSSRKSYTRAVLGTVTSIPVGAHSSSDTGPCFPYIGGMSADTAHRTGAVPSSGQFVLGDRQVVRAAFVGDGTDAQRVMQLPRRKG